MKSRIGQMLIAALAVALTTLSFGGYAGAQDDDNYGSSAVPAVTGHIAVADGGFSSIANGNTTGATRTQATGVMAPAADASVATAPAAAAEASAAAEAAGAPRLAYTGVESAYLAFAGLGLVGAGATVLAARRRIQDPFED